MAEATPGATAPAATPPADTTKKEGEGTAAAEGTKPAEAAKPEGKTAAGLFDGAAEAAAAAPVDKPEEVVDPNSADAYLLAEGVMGKGKKPEWFKADKYKTVEEQARAYVEAEKRFGAFVGAPKDGKYEAPPMPEGIEGEFITDHPVMQKFGEWAAKSQLSQAGYNEVLSLLAEYEASQVPDMAAIKQSLGANADQRIGAVTGWAKANLSPDQFAVFRDVGKTAAAGQMLQIMEAVIDKARATTTPPRVGADVAAAAPVSGLAAVHELHAKRGADGKLLYDTDLKYRQKVDQAYRDHFSKAS